jgi:hypothetical protein
MAVVFYALAACVAVRVAAERALKAPRGQMVAIVAGVLVLAAAWQLRQSAPWKMCESAR